MALRVPATIVGEPEERESFRLSLTALPTIGRREAPNSISRVFSGWISRPKLRQPSLEVSQEALRIRSVLKAGHGSQILSRLNYPVFLTDVRDSVAPALVLDNSVPASVLCYIANLVFHCDGLRPIELTLILPAYNEAATICGTVGEAVRYLESRKIGYDIVVAADGDDGTRELVAELAAANPAIRVIGQRERGGKGRGIREAVRIAKGALIGFADADNKVPIEEYDKFAPLLNAGAPIVIGSRAIAGSRILREQPWYRQIGSQCFAVLMRTVTGLKVADTQCGFKFFQAAVARQLFDCQRIDGYMYDVELLYLAHRFRHPVLEVPICWKDDGDSRLDLVRGNIQNVIDLLRIRFYYRYPAGKAANEKVFASSERARAAR